MIVELSIIGIIPSHWIPPPYIDAELLIKLLNFSIDILHGFVLNEVHKKNKPPPFIALLPIILFPYIKVNYEFSMAIAPPCPFVTILSVNSF